MAKTHDVHIRFSQEEHEKLKKKASLIGIAVSTYARMVCLASNVKVENKTKI